MNVNILGDLIPQVDQATHIWEKYQTPEGVVIPMALYREGEQISVLRWDRLLAVGRIEQKENTLHMD